jgi:hypothetical protein
VAEPERVPDFVRVALLEAVLVGVRVTVALEDGV